MDKELYQLLSMMSEAKRVYYVNGNTDYQTQRNLAKALQLKFVTVTFDDNTDVYTLTADADAAIAAYELVEKIEAPNLQANELIYPALFQNKQNKAIVLAISETAGTIVKEASYFETFDWIAPLGTFQTCFIPFSDNTEWERVHSVAIDLE